MQKKTISYESIYDEIQRRYDNGEITYEKACEVNDIAYDRYVVEATRLAKEIRKHHLDAQDKYKKMNDENESDDKKLVPELKRVGEIRGDFEKSRNAKELAKRYNRIDSKSYGKDYAKKISRKNRNVDDFVGSNDIKERGQVRKYNQQRDFRIDTDPTYIDDKVEAFNRSPDNRDYILKRTIRQHLNK